MLDQGPTSLFLFTPSSPLRRMATWVCMSKAFETIITCTIILNCVTMMLDEKLGNGDRAILSGQLVRKMSLVSSKLLRHCQDPDTYVQIRFPFLALSFLSISLPVASSVNITKYCNNGNGLRVRKREEGCNKFCDTLGLWRHETIMILAHPVTF